LTPFPFDVLLLPDVATTVTQNKEQKAKDNTMKTGQTTQNPPLKRYAIDELVEGSYTDHNGRTEEWSIWKEICVLEATRQSNAARVAERKWVGQLLRVRLLGRTPASWETSVS
jgi:hypothetical protein